MEKSKTPVLTGKEGEEFDVHVAAAWTKNHRERRPEDPHSHFFGKEILEKILNQEGCVGLRFYYGHTHPASEPKSEKHLIIVGAKSDGSDMVNTAKNKPLSRLELKAVAPADDVIGQQAMPCPGSPGCPKSL
ncbi:MAG: hypothetical protein M3O71_27920 [Bacteroidota bacterium]|nr:hypothetical protein [Bacteroidota bacterium]